MLALIATILSSILFNLSLVLQGIDARASSATLSFRPGLLVHLIKQPWWVLGSLLGLAALALDVYALRTLPLGFVQPMIAAGILVFPVAAVLLDQPFSWQVIVAGTAIVAGVIVLGDAAPVQSPGIRLAPGPVLVFALAAPIDYLLLRGWRDPALLAVIAGVSYGCTGLFCKLLAAGGSPVEMIVPALALLSVGIVGFLAEMSALQKLPPLVVAPPILALETLLPIVVGRVLLGER